MRAAWKLRKPKVCPFGNSPPHARLRNAPVDAEDHLLYSLLYPEEE